jgi:hypothetical protein
VLLFIHGLTDYLAERSAEFVNWAAFGLSNACHSRDMNGDGRWMTNADTGNRRAEPQEFRQNPSDQQVIELRHPSASFAERLAQQRRATEALTLAMLPCPRRLLSLIV